MRVLVTGADGFVGRHLCGALRDAGDEVLEWHGPNGERPVEIRDAAAVTTAMAADRPTAVVHLAAVSSVAASHAEPVETFDVNAKGALNICVAARRCSPSPKLLLVSSGEVYGAIPQGSLARESSPLLPTSPYASSKVAAEAVGFQFARSYGLTVVCARPFNHLGAGQAPTFAVQSFARQLVDARRRGDRTARISVGNLEPVRDISHVADVVAAYRLLLDRGAGGEAYNICSGEGRSIRSVLDELAEIVGTPLDVHVDPARLRPVDVPYLVGDASKLRALGWTPTTPLRTALREIVDEQTGR